MLKPSLIPSPLIEPSRRQPIGISARQAVLRFRGAYVTFHLLVLLARLAGLRLLGRAGTRQVGQMLRAFCLHTGVLWIKVGQLISIRRDLFPQEICDELVRLQDHADGFSPEEARRFVEAELGEPLERHFSEFDETPCAAASISQIHRARLRKTGAAVAVKVQRPGIESTFASDMRLIEWLAGWLIRLSVLPHVRWNDLIWEIQQILEEELDFRFEATNLRRMKKTLRPHGVYVPAVFGRYCTRHVLVMEFIDGVTMSDYLSVSRDDAARRDRWLEENNVNPRRVARRIVLSHLRQTFEDNLFHADLHPGNILLLKDSRIAFIDFGSVGFFERDFLEKYDLYTRALYDRHFSKMIDLYLLFAVELPPANLSGLKDEFIKSLQSFETRRRVRELPYSERSLGGLNRDLIALFGKHHIALDWTFLRVMRAWFTLDMSLSSLMPDVDMLAVIKQYYRQRLRRQRRRLLAGPPTTGPGWLRTILEFPRKASEQAMYRGAVIRRLAMVFDDTATRVTQFFAAMFSWLAFAHLLGGLFLLIALLEQHRRLWLPRVLHSVLAGMIASVPALDYQVWIVVFTLVLYGYRAFAGLKRRFHQAEAKLPGT